jgi:UDP-N-acetylglucosamine acyltransferase
LSNIIHSTAIVSEGVELGENVSVGPYCILEGDIKVGAGTVFKSHCVVSGNVEIGRNNRFFSFCSIGEEPQDIGYRGEDTTVRIGDNNTVREFVSIHRGTAKQDKVTSIGSGNLLMAKAHVGHDTVIGDDCIIVNSVNLAGHVTIGDKVTISGNCGVTQFVKIGSAVYVGASTTIDKDVPSYCAVIGNRAKLKGVNIVGLRRQGFSKTDISELVNFIRSMEASPLSPRGFVELEENVDEYSENQIVLKVISEIKESRAGIVPFSR